MTSRLVASFAILAILVVFPAHAQLPTEIILQPQLDQLDPSLRTEYKAQGLSERDVAKKVQETVAGQIEQRLRDAGVTGATIRRLDDGAKILVRFAEEKDLQRNKGLLTRRGSLRFYAMLSPEDAKAAFSAIANDARFKKMCDECLIPPVYPGGPYRVSTQNVFRFKAALDEILKDPNLIAPRDTLLLSRAPAKGERQEYGVFLVRKDAVLTGEELADAQSERDRQTDKFMVTFAFSPRASEKIGHYTEMNIKKVLPIALDDCVVSAPVIQSKITKNGCIAGNFSEQEAREIALALKSGPFPAPVAVVK